ncbi:SpaA isopeptide-forming pilin-related protein [Schleiferilactobacillus perolens]|jgi:hypothetical protein|uniref:SpaA isopeptide-forming pilin-related protein n=1 Tax=Schleiferilactobacillus perolens TaxID=100468 RepID=UPI0023534C9E|nr:SpaA isopeptide-forming pilin-related protein [Schleiferilactobacillus perolens]MCI2172127.1 hypothetical protein [Schleiferilactobacillus perolens]
MNSRRLIGLGFWTVLIALFSGLIQSPVAHAETESEWHEHTYKATFKSRPFISDIRMKNAGDESNIFLYNVVLSGDHSADGADTEGAMAIQGNSTIPATNRYGNGNTNFNYAGFFNGSGGGSNDVESHPLTDQHRIALLMGGEIHKYGEGGHALVSGQAGQGQNNGYFVVRHQAVKDLNSWLQNGTNPVRANGRVYHTDEGDAPKMDDIFARIFATQGMVEDELTRLVGDNKGKPYTVDGIEQTVSSFWGWGGDDSMDVPIHQSTEDAGTLIIHVPARPGTDTAYIPGLHKNNPAVNDPAVKRIIITTDQPKVVARDTNAGDKSQKVAGKTIYWLPKATQVTNYALEKTAEAPYVPPVNNSAVNNYNQAYFDPMDCYGTALSGSMIAPLATVAWSGAHINGYLWTKNFQQSGGAEAHNFYTPPLETLVDFLLGVNKSNSEDQIMLADADFIMYRILDGKTEYLAQTSPEKWTSQRNEAQTLTTDSYGQIRVRLRAQKDKKYQYYFHETKAPPGFEQPAPDNAHEVAPGSEQLIANIAEVTNKPVTGQSVGFHKTNQFDHPLVGMSFTLTSTTDPTKHFTAVSNDEGFVEFNGVTEGEYRLVEKTQNTVGPTEWLVEIVVKDGQAILQFKDTGQSVQKIVNRKLLSLRLRKVDEHNALLVGAKFRLQGPSGYDKTVPDDEHSVGTFVFPRLAPGKYTLTEIEAPAGYELLKEPITIVVTEDMKTITADGKPLQANQLVFGHTIQNRPAVGGLPATGGWGQTAWYLIAGSFAFAALNVGIGYYVQGRKGRRS